MPMRRNFKLKVGVEPIKIPDPAPPKQPEIPLGDVATVTIDQQTFSLTVDDLEDEGELGRGAYGTVNKMRHKETGTIMAVKRIRATLDQQENKHVLMDYNIAMRSLDCPFTITFYGALFREGDVWICMELMDRSLDLLCRSVYARLKERIPEEIVGFMAYATLKALNYLKTVLNVMHRDVKPSNILINRKGEIKLCDFGISGELVNSFAKTDIGCRPYLAPERIMGGTKKYDHRSDVWSYGITLYELAVGEFPYKQYKNVFEQIKLVIEGEAPRMPDDMGFSENFKDYVHRCLTKEKDSRCRYEDMLVHDFIRSIEGKSVDVASWYGELLAKESSMPPQAGAAAAN